MNHIEGILDLADKEFEAIVKNGKFRSREEIDSAYKLMDIVKDGMCILDWEDEDSEMSMNYGSYRGRSYRGEDDRSYANRRRDRMGRYTSREDYRGGRSMRGYSRDDGKEEYIEHLHELMEDAPDDATRQSIQRMIDNMK